MNDNIKRSLFLMNYAPGKTLSVVSESIDNLFESKQTEMEAISFFRKMGVNEKYAMKAIEEFRTVDQTKNKSLTLPMTISYVRSGDLSHVLKTFKIVSELINANKIPRPTIDKPYFEGRFHVGDKAFNNYNLFSEYIINMSELSSGYSQWKTEFSVESDVSPIYPRTPEEEKSGIMIYDGNDVGRCIKYGMGGLTGQYYQFCISKPANTNWQGYRDTKGSTFYFVFDKNRKLEDPLHMTVVDRTTLNNNYQGYEVTDVNNKTNNIAQFGDDILSYIRYLQERGVPTEEIFVNQPKTESEKEEQIKLGGANESLSWFKELSFNEKTKYIGRGHLLSYEQFKFLWTHRKTQGGFHLLNQYLNIGNPLPNDQFMLLTSDDDNEI